MLVTRCMQLLSPRSGVVCIVRTPLPHQATLRAGVDPAGPAQCCRHGLPLI